jgi:hypothetical protein
MPGMKEKKKSRCGRPEKRRAERPIIGGAKNPAIFPDEIAIFYAAYRM